MCVCEQAGWRRPGPGRPGEETRGAGCMVAAGGKRRQLLTRHRHGQQPQRTQGTQRSMLVGFTGALQRFLFLLQSCYFCGQPLTVFSFCSFSPVPTSCSLYLSHKQNLSNPVNIHREKLTLTSLVFEQCSFVEGNTITQCFLSSFSPDNYFSSVETHCAKYTERCFMKQLYILLLTFTADFPFLILLPFVNKSTNQSIFVELMVSVFPLAGPCRGNGCTERTSRMGQQTCPSDPGQSQCEPTEQRPACWQTESHQPQLEQGANLF